MFVYQYMRPNIVSYFFLAISFSCNSPHKNSNAEYPINEKIAYPKPDSAGYFTNINTGKTHPAEIITFARSLTGIRYKYASTDPTQGFDCSGFITYVFNHFGIAVPRNSIDFTFIHRGVRLNEAKPGDLILFTGTDSTIRKVGHMGIVVSHPGEEVRFIHATSGKAYGVTETALNRYYSGRYVKTIRVFF